MSTSDTLHRPPGPFVLWMLRAYLGGGRGRLCVLHSFKQTDWIRIWNESSCWSGGIRRGRLSDRARQGYSVARNQYIIRRIHILGARTFLQLSSVLCACRFGIRKSADRVNQLKDVQMLQLIGPDCASFAVQTAAPVCEYPSWVLMPAERIG